MADQPKGQRCELCRYWQAQPRQFLGRSYDGQCRRFPPSVPTEDYDVTFPAMHRRGWCGEYAPARPATVEDGAATLARFVLLGDLTAARALADKLKE